MRVIIVRGLSVSELEELVAQMWLAVEACGTASPTVSASPQSATWTVQFLFRTDGDVARVIEKLRDFPLLSEIRR